MEENKNFENIKKFFEYNVKIKDELIKAAPDVNYSDGDYTIMYVKKLDNALRNISMYFKMIFNSVGATEEEQKYVLSFLDNCRNYINNNPLSLNELELFYKNCISNMREELINKLNKECKGYYIFSNASIKDGETVNEMLHIIHHRVVNNENYYSSMPVIDKKGEDQAAITLYGDENELARKIFSGIMSTKETYETSILSLSEDKILIMVRGAGHALTIEVEKDKENDDYMVRYFIPKVTNIELVNMLPGVRKVTEGYRETSGKFTASNDEVAMKVCNFIVMVPRDFDSFHYSTSEILYNKKLEINKLLETAKNDEVFFRYLSKKLAIVDEEIEKLEQKDEMTGSGIGGMK